MMQSIIWHWPCFVSIRSYKRNATLKTTTLRLRPWSKCKRKLTYKLTYSAQSRETAAALPALCL